MTAFWLGSSVTLADRRIVARCVLTAKASTISGHTVNFMSVWIGSKATIASMREISPGC
jgi:hypothetical protein